MLANYQIFGLQRTGTNWLKRLLELNYGAGGEFSQWKHSVGEGAAPQDGVYTIGIVKDPYSWIASCWRNPTDMATEDARRRQGNHIKERGGAITVESLCALYEAWVTEWGYKIPIIRYEDLLARPRETLETVSLCFLGSEWQETGLVKHSPLWTEERKADYLGGGRHLCPEDVRNVNRYLSRSVFERFDYPWLGQHLPPDGGSVDGMPST
ncbi:MAG: hypothetical protein GY889_09475 [Proteobacteria bacterium]|jgi:hypothetical protein|nr:hypothetical protein [Pseudomonadota bacterium]